MKKYFFLLFFNFLLFTSSAQDHLIKWRDKTPLTWNDFLDTPPAGNPYGATANTGISYGFKYAKSGDQVDLTFEVFSYFDKNGSWSKKEKQTPKLLKHEQLHFDIAEIQARRLRKAFASATFTDNYQVEIRRIFDLHMKALLEMQQRYDKESDHSMNPEKQAEWEAYVRMELEKTKGEAISPAVGLKQPMKARQE